MPAAAGPDEASENEAPEAQEEGTSCALADLPNGDGTKVGEKVPMEVVSVDTENGTAMLKCSARPTSMSGGGIKKMAAAYDENPEG